MQYSKKVIYRPKMYEERFLWLRTWVSCLLYDFFTVVCITVFIKHLKVRFILLKFDLGYAAKMAIFNSLNWWFSWTFLGKPCTSNILETFFQLSIAILVRSVLPFLFRRRCIHGMLKFVFSRSTRPWYGFLFLAYRLNYFWVRFNKWCKNKNSDSYNEHWRTENINHFC